MRSNIHFYTDGSCKWNPGPGGYAFVVVESPYESHVYSFYKSVKYSTTNNRMEMEAFIAAMKHFNSNYIGADMTIYSDSALICNTLNKSWYKKWEVNGWLTSKKDPVANKDLWQEMLPLYKEIVPTVEHVKGHNGNKFNEIADNLAQRTD